MSAKIFTSADRIRELSAINADVPKLLSSAGQAINALTNRPLASPGIGDDATNGHSQDPTDGTQSTNALDAHKAAFVTNTTAYFTTLQSLSARLRRQVYALEEAGMITAEAAAVTSQSALQAAAAVAQATKGARGAANAQAGVREEPAASSVTNGGLGNLDVGWLNSRGDRVGKEKEAELFAEARKLAEDAERSWGGKAVPELDETENEPMDDAP
ncbi:hypothetical protein B0A49_04946 [Cryomyces minteri]|uniref:Mediator of RNA polymerase II transcription subunit 11 n=1 Tax=Cryomyces minteri TaxID=331657 RepID=A0A4V5NG62_9PEZI|nr:hypothetical protein B0A49_04946 [Cryomyces minteri]